jgi:cation transporter-like permease
MTALAGCAQDVVTQMRKSTTVRNQVMTAIASDRVFASDITQQMVANDSVRTRVVDTMLLDPRVAQYVLMRIGTNPDAVDIVLRTALADSIGRAHLVARMETIRKGLAQAK